MSVELIEKTINKIVEKLSLSEIKNIVSIDNDWSINKSVIDTNSNLLNFLHSHSLLTEDDELELSNDGSVILIKDLLNSNNLKLNSLRTTVQNIISQSELPPTLMSLKFLLEEIEKKVPGINIIKSEKIDTDFSQFNENSLFILDKDMGEGYSDVIIENIIKINDLGRIKNDIILIYSSASIIEYENNSSKLQYLRDKIQIDDKDKYNLLIYKMWAISKKGDVAELLPEVYNMLLNSIYGNSLYNIIQYKLSAEKDAYNDLIRIDTTELSSTIKDSYIEGDNIIQSLDRIYDSLKSKHETEKMNNIYMKSIGSLISFERESISNIIREELQGYSNFRNNQVKEKIKLCKENAAQYAIVDYSVNKYYYDISTGDIFRFRNFDSSNWEYGVLISQSCSCVLRIQGNDINNIQRSSNQMQLLILNGNQIKDDYSNSELRDIRNNIWPIKIDGQVLMLTPTSQIITIDDAIIDLCTLSINGQANLNFNVEDIKNYKPFHSIKYFESFKQKYFGDEFKMQGELLISKYEDTLRNFFEQYNSEVACASECSYYTRIGQETNNIRNEIFNKTISLKYNLNFHDNSFDIVRIGRLEPKRTLILIQDYVYNLSKAGADPIPVN
ncbi:MAG: hypothetical protein K0R50_726 [Eubacterium sp.]|jgi:hypothetical protein|nr:hypothetical protein [Eubacterium sp.]